MRAFSPGKLDAIRRGKYPNFSDFFRALVIDAPEYNIKPHINHIHNIMNGKFSPGAGYLALFAHVLSCKVDSFFVKKEPAEATDEKKD